ncbi:unnamed protein product [Durusdinium trenchii]|uniref:Ion transport domain-containing protein n=1 Tax=Durusdinium trenchii TaxID=1381693 RepID=A0ABP0P7X1_9DINO
MDLAVQPVEESFEVERPQQSPTIRPGHLWKNETGETLDVAIKGVRSSTMDMAEEILDLLKRQHNEVVKRLDWQESLLKEMAVDRTCRQEEDQLKEEKNDQLEEKEVEDSWEKVFRTFESIDAGLKEGAANVDEAEAANRKKRQQSSHSMPSHGNCIGKLTSHPWFDIFFACIVVTNSIFIGIEVSYSTAGHDPLAITVIRHSYGLIFTVELLMRVTAVGRAFFCTDDWMWNWLDVFIVLTSVYEIVDDIFLRNLIEDDNTGVTFTGLKALRLVRITRIVKVARLARVLRFVMALRTLISSIIYTLKSLIWAMILLSLIVYVFAVLFAQAVGDVLNYDPSVLLTRDGDYDAAVKYWSSLEESMLSLFMSIAGGLSWDEAIRPLQAISTGWLFVFVFYISFTYFAVLNVVTGVFCQSAIDSAQNDQTMVLQSILAAKQANTEKIRQLFQAIDIEDSGVVTYKMLEQSVLSGQVQTIFESIGLDVWDAWSFFKLLDLDAGGAVEIEEFLQGCLRLRGEARAMDVVKIVHDQGWLIRQQSRFWTFMEEQVRELKASIDDVKRSPR